MALANADGLGGDLHQLVGLDKLQGLFQAEADRGGEEDVLVRAGGADGCELLGFEGVDGEAAPAAVAALMTDDPLPGTPAGDRLEVLTTLVQAYEAQHYPVSAPDPIEAIKFRLAYHTGLVFVKFVGTHAEYDHIDAETFERS